MDRPGSRRSMCSIQTTTSSRSTPPRSIENSEGCTGDEMKRHTLAGVFGVALALILNGTPGLSQSQPPTQGPAVGETPAWFLQGSFPDPAGRTIVERVGMSPSRLAVADPLAAPARRRPRRRHAALAAVRKRGLPRGQLQRVQWQQTMGYTFMYPYVLPPGFGGVPSVALDSKGNLWAFQRAEAGKAAAVQVRPEPQDHSPGRRRRHRLPGQGARHGGRCRRQRLDHRRTAPP